MSLRLPQLADAWDTKAVPTPSSAKHCSPFYEPNYLFSFLPAAPIIRL